jgi:CRISPR/Cas system endoribonuclease Cas6 (RAMP superfamily)
MKMGGFVGGVEYSGEVSDFLPLLKVGEKVHVGKATGFGLGKYVIDRQKDSPCDCPTDRYLA